MRPIEYQTPDLTLVPEAWRPAIRQRLELLGMVQVTCENHTLTPLCACGDNAYCRTCGQGKGSMPCRCTRDATGWQVDLHQRLNLIARLCLMCPDQSRVEANTALNELFDEGRTISLIERFNLPRMQLIAAAQLDRPQSRARWLSDMLDEMGVPE